MTCRFEAAFADFLFAGDADVISASLGMLSDAARHRHGCLPQDAL